MKDNVASTERFDVIAVALKGGAVRVFAQNYDLPNAEAVIKFAVMRRGVDVEFYTIVAAPSGYRDGDIHGSPSGAQEATMPKTEDFYDRAVAYFHEHPEEIMDAWKTPIHHPRGTLFGILSADRFTLPRSPDGCGCPSQVRSGYRTGDAELTERVREMREIPKLQANGRPLITVLDLSAFARAQRLADKMLNRPEPQGNA